MKRRLSLLLTMLTMICGTISSTDISTVAEVRAGANGETFRVRGACTEIGDMGRGDWTLTDNTGSLYVMGTRDKNGDIGYGFHEWGIRENDTITIEGVKNGRVWDYIVFENVYVIDVKKADFSIISVEPSYVPAGGGEVKVRFQNKRGTHVSTGYSVDYKDYILSVVSLEEGTEPVISIHVAPNEGLDRSFEVFFSNYDNSSDRPDPEIRLIINQSGTAMESTVGDFLAAKPSDMVYGINGILTAISEGPESENKTYELELSDYTGKVTGKMQFTSNDTKSLGFDVGDIVTLIGKRANDDNGDYMEVTSASLKNKVVDSSIAEVKKNSGYEPDIYFRYTGTVDDINNTIGYLYITDSQDRLDIFSFSLGYGDYQTDIRQNVEKANIEIGDEVTFISNIRRFWGDRIFVERILVSHKKKEAKKYTSDDIVSIIDLIVGGGYSADYDANSDGKVNVADIILIVNLIINQQSE